MFLKQQTAAVFHPYQSRERRVKDNILQPFHWLWWSLLVWRILFVEKQMGGIESNSKIKRFSFLDEQSDSYSPFLFFNVSVKFAMFHSGTWLISQWPWGPSLSSSQFNWLVVQWGGPSDESGKPRPRVSAGLVR